jgi:DNA-directed RNA polymerase specialized sigma24 family protein
MVAVFYLEVAQDIDHSAGTVRVWARRAVKDGREIEFLETVNTDRF